MNRKSRKNSTSKYKGVSWYKRTNKWRAIITVNGKNKYLGYFTSETETAAVYDLHARKHFGEFANLNFKCPVFSISKRVN